MHLAKVSILVCVFLMSCATGTGAAPMVGELRRSDRMQGTRGGQRIVRRKHTLTTNSQDDSRANSPTPTIGQAAAVPTVQCPEGIERGNLPIKTPQGCLGYHPPVSKWIRNDGKCYTIDTAIANFASEEGRCWVMTDMDYATSRPDTSRNRNRRSGPGGSGSGSRGSTVTIVKQYSGSFNARNRTHNPRAF
ncbi:hypothetical protein AMATHDRAFT_8096 [Amanita thiersii Skay4041]|uniref:Uncharacterized protein n=1 Tax=Amanita thiersii Skay4041 TaxID=703135 RepID=A0A2A9NEQ7_9AGAR|nr:hypothetical protein AMATHDRAFT_8096 [Amanita thiersii Skay4041]